MSGLLIRNAQIGSDGIVDLRIRDGRIVELATSLRGEELLDACGAGVLPGLADHHIHVLALAAKAASVAVDHARDASEFAQTVTQAAAGLPQGAWLRIVGYHERMAGDISRDELDRLAPGHRVRVQHQTGSLWILNSAALDAVAGGCDPPASLERDVNGKATGRVWRGDAWLGERIGRATPDLRKLGAVLASYGVTALTDATASTDVVAAGVLAGAHRCGDLPQRLRLMSARELAAPEDGAFEIGEIKVLLDEHHLPDWQDMGRRIRFAHACGRAVALHCVTAAELAFALAAFDAFSARRGSRIEHGGLIPAEAIPRLKALALTVVTQPSFVHERGDRYAEEVAPGDVGDLYRCASLLAAKVALAASSDAPYGDPDPWRSIQAAMTRSTRGGQTLGEAERVSGAQALSLFLGPLDLPGGPARRICVGAPADLCVLRAPLCEILQAPHSKAVAATLIGGRVVFAG